MKTTGSNMKKVFEITNPELFFSKVESLSINIVFGNNGDVVINDNCITGNHEDNDYENEYGFILCEPKWVICDKTSNGGIYIGEDGDNCRFVNNAQEFDAENQATQVIVDNEWQDWAYVQEVGETEY